MGQPFIQFGSGLLFLGPNAGNLAANPTPQKPYTLQDIKIESAGKIEMLRGQYQYPDDTATGDKDGKWEFSMGRQDYGLLNQVFNADTTTSGGTSVVISPATAIPVSPFTITPTIPGSGVWAGDLGVSFSSNNQQLTKITGTPTAGQYAVTAGAYLFSSADHGSALSVIITCSYTLTTGATYQVNNQVQGWGPAMEVFLVNTYQPVSSVYSVVRLYAAKVSDVSFDNKRSGYGMVALKGSYYAASNGRVIDFFSNVG